MTMSAPPSEREVLAPAPSSDPAVVDRTPADSALHDRVVRYYQATSEDYGAWSPSYHMHFGYYRRGLDPRDLESMLAEMTRQVLARLELDLERPHRLLDMGCGLGASARLIAAERPALRIDAVTLVPWQARRARQLARAAGSGDALAFHAADYTATAFADATFDGAYAIESACHAAGVAKVDFVREAARLIAPGGRLAVADGFLRRPAPRRGPFRWCLDRVCARWALETFAELDPFVAALEAHGFADVRVEEIGWRVAPSVAHVPRVTLAFLWRELRRSRLRLSADRRGHVLACVLSPLLGMARHRFGYYLVSARRR